MIKIYGNSLISAQLRIFKTRSFKLTITVPAGIMTHSIPTMMTRFAGRTRAEVASKVPASSYTKNWLSDHSMSSPILHIFPNSLLWILMEFSI